MPTSATHFPRTAPVEPAAEYRAGFLRAVEHLCLNVEGARRLAEAVTGQRFEDCGQAELEPLVRELSAIAHTLRTRWSESCCS